MFAIYIHDLVSWHFSLLQVSFADYNLFDFLDNHLVLSSSALDAYPILKAYYERMINRPAIKAYRETAEHKGMNINGNGKQ